MTPDKYNIEKLNAEVILNQARIELRHEEFRAAIEKEKERLRNKKSFFSKLFPFKIIIIRR